MTREEIERYGGICDKLIALRAVKVCDTVQGSSSEIPYQKHTVMIEGQSQVGKSSKIQALQRKKAEIEAAVDAIQNEQDHAIVRMRVLGRMEWGDITAKLEKYSEEALRKKYQRIMEKYF